MSYGDSNSDSNPESNINGSSNESSHPQIQIHEHKPNSVPQKRGPWSTDEDQKLMELINLYGPSNWVRISTFLGTRTAKQCRERYHQNLKPSLNRSPITPEEGALIEELVQRYGKRWAEIARHLNSRSDNAIKNWWNGGANRRRRASAQGGIPTQAETDNSSNHNNENLNLPPPPTPLVQLPALQHHNSYPHLQHLQSISQNPLAPNPLLQNHLDHNTTQEHLYHLQQPININQHYNPSTKYLTSQPMQALSSLNSTSPDLDNQFSVNKQRRILDRRHSAATILTNSNYVSPSSNSLTNSRNSSISFDTFSSNDSLTSNSASRRSSIIDNSVNFDSVPGTSRKRHSIYSYNSPNVNKESITLPPLSFQTSNSPVSLPPLSSTNQDTIFKPNFSLSNKHKLSYENLTNNVSSNNNNNGGEIFKSNFSFDHNKQNSISSISNSSINSTYYSHTVYQPSSMTTVENASSPPSSSGKDNTTPTKKINNKTDVSPTETIQEEKKTADDEKKDNDNDNEKDRIAIANLLS